MSLSFTTLVRVRSTDNSLPSFVYIRHQHHHHTPTHTKDSKNNSKRRTAMAMSTAATTTRLFIYFFIVMDIKNYMNKHFSTYMHISKADGWLPLPAANKTVLLVYVVDMLGVVCVYRYCVYVARYVLIYICRLSSPFRSVPLRCRFTCTV